jgi:predicted nucleic acid-binding protein
MAFVVDASLTMAWCFEDEFSDATDLLLQRAATEILFVPIGWRVEVVNSLIIGERRNRCTTEQSALFTAQLNRLEIETDTLGQEQAFKQLPILCRKYRLTAYDAAYLELAMRLHLPLATLDLALKKAALDAGVQII